MNRNVVRAVVSCAVLLFVQRFGFAQPPPVEPEAPAADAAPVKEPAAIDDSKPAASAPPESSTGKITWAEGLAAGRQRARDQNRPLLVRFGGAGCAWCEKLALELARPEVERSLAAWSLCYVDVDAAPNDARRLGVTGIPALRVVDPGGRVVAQHDGYLNSQQLLAWLGEHLGGAQAPAAELLVGDQPPDAAAVAALIDELRRAEPARREAALRRLLAHPQTAAWAVVAALGRGTLSTRLAALELLGEWQAPIEGLDPWRPETLTAERQLVLRDWAAEQHGSIGPRPLTDEKLHAAEAEIDKLLVGDESAAAAAIERLARLGPDLLPTVYQRLSAAQTDQARQRLLALRYRLVAGDALVLRWPGGIARLASPRADVRHAAAEELVDSARPGDERLLVELFSDPDPLTREISLRGLQNIGGQQGSRALVELLEDPEPNVQAAVLKQLAEQPPGELVGKVAAYAVKQSDPDLVVHAIRFLKAAKSPEAITGLIQLLKHESWQVRAEAAEALGETAGHQGGNFGQVDARQADLFVALIDLLEDSDAFVVSRAMKALQSADLPAAALPLLAAAEKHPELAPDIMELVAQGQNMQREAGPRMKQFVRHADPRVRAAAVRGLAALEGGDAGPVLIDALADEAGEVRRAAARSLFAQAQAAMQQDLQVGAVGHRQPRMSLFGRIATSIFGKIKPAPGKPQDNPAERWLVDYRSGKSRPEWMAKCIVPLEKMLTAEEVDERLAAALALVPLARDETARPVLIEIARSQPAQRTAVADALPWLLWQDRLGLLDELLSRDLQSDAVLQICQQFVLIRDPRAGEPLWRLLDRADASPALAAAVYYSLNALYQPDANAGMFGGSHVTSEVLEVIEDSPVLEGSTAPAENPAPEDKPEPSDKPAADDEPAPGDEEMAGDEPVPVARAEPDELVPELKRRAATGSRWQRTVALAMLQARSREDVKEPATAILEEAGADPEFRADALQLLLASLPAEEAEAGAVKYIDSSVPRLRKTALRYLALGNAAIAQFDESIYLSVDSSMSTMPGEAVAVMAPAELKADPLRPLLRDPDPQIAAAAGYLLATLGERDGLETLIAHWRHKENQADPLWKRAVYRAIAALDDDSQTPVLAEIYESFDQWTVRDFYWTIRSMHGPEVLKLRKRVREEIGMDNLR